MRVRDESTSSRQPSVDQEVVQRIKRIIEVAIPADEILIDYDLVVHTRRADLDEPVIRHIGLSQADPGASVLVEYVSSRVAGP